MELQDEKPNIEFSVKKKIGIEREFIGKLLPKKGHTLFQINKETLEIVKYVFVKRDYIYDPYNPAQKINKEVAIKDGFAYISALNKKNALKKYLKQK